MNAQEVAISTWRQQKKLYQKAMRTVIEHLSQPIPLVPSPQYDTKFDELKEYLKFNYIYDEDDKFIQIYVHQIAGQKNISLMELSNQLINNIGGSISFWQSKITQISLYQLYHPQLSIWEINRVFEKHMGLSPEFTSNLAKRKSLARNYLSALTAMCKNIQKGKANQEDLLKIDESFRRVKKMEQKYYSFLQQTQNRKYAENSNVSKRTKNNVKESLFLFLKPKKQTPSQYTLMNYNFKCKPSQAKTQTLLEDKEYQQFDEIFKTLRKESFSRRVSRQKSRKQYSFTEATKVQTQQLRNQFLSKVKKEKKNEENCKSTFIWSKQYFFTYWGYIINYREPIDFTTPFQRYQNINYQIDSEEQFDELNAQDILDEVTSQYSSLQNDSFVVSDNHDSSQNQEEEQKPGKYNYFSQGLMKPWVRYGVDMKEYQIQSIYSQDLPLPLQEEQISLCMIDKLHYKGRNEIFEFFEKESESGQISKIKIQAFLKKNFRKIKTKDKKIVYVKLQDEERGQDKETKFNANESSEAQTLGQSYEISISAPSKIKQLSQQDQNNLSNVNESQSNSNTLSVML